ncbi:protein roadkill-like [Schistocerca serialis cubense]|uniref:protein roadkill-like n=1 Tax=Schistocerca serialis cubense TaxID=2023355 RepID=UPI00214EDADB|nr:protein roadkill-like [Schistocerca serialis cubense]
MSMDKSPGSGDNIPPSPTLAAAEDTVCDLGSVRIGKDKVVVCRWTIEDIKSWPTWNDEVKSPIFRDSNSNEWCMVLLRNFGDWYVCFQLLSSRNNATVRVSVKVSVVSSRGTKYSYPLEFVSLAVGNKTTRHSMTDCIEKEGRFSNVLKFLGEVSTPYFVREVYRSVALQRPRRRVTDDLAALLESGQLSDVKLRAVDAEFQTHRTVLSARSPVFSAMLRHDTQEARDGIVHIKDVEADVLREVLRFIYTDSTPLLEKMADRLLVVADKYDLPQLKELCEVELAKNLTVDNAAATAVIALSHSCDILKQSVVSFVKRHRVPIMDSKGWAEALRNHPEISSWK